MTLPVDTATDADAAKRSVLARAFDILDCFGADHPEQTITRLCDRTGLPPATVHRMLAGLVEWGAVERSGRGRYRLGRRLWRLGWGVHDVRQLREFARPFMVDLYSATGELAALCTREDDGVIVTDLIGGRSVTPVCRLEHRLPLLDSAPGLAYLAHAVPEELEQLLSARDRGDGFRVRQHLAQVRRTGVAVTPARTQRAYTWVSAPVFGADGRVRSTLSVVAPGHRANVHGMSHTVLGAARGLGRMLSRHRAEAPLRSA